MCAHLRAKPRMRAATLFRSVRGSNLYNVYAVRDAPAATPPAAQP
jgi:hypothetical protein